MGCYPSISTVETLQGAIDGTRCSSPGASTVPAAQTRCLVGTGSRFPWSRWQSLAVVFQVRPLSPSTSSPGLARLLRKGAFVYGPQGHLSWGRLPSTPAPLIQESQVRFPAPRHCSSLILLNYFVLQIQSASTCQAVLGPFLFVESLAT